MDCQKENHQIYTEFVDENFIVGREKGRYAPLYFLPKNYLKYNEVFKVGDFNKTKESTDYRREVVPMPFTDFFKEIGLEIVIKEKNEFIYALVDYLKNNQKL